LWPPDRPGDLHVWTILDGARSPEIFAAVQATLLPKCCLYAGDLRLPLQYVAPYLVRLERGDWFTNEVIKYGWGNAWGVFLRSGSDLRELRHHLRRFLRVADESGRRLVFRYYDPRVLRVYLPTCLTAELEIFFGPVAQFVMEDDDATAVLEFSFDGRQLVRKRVIGGGVSP
jgi:hypothetical protein